mgnify:CR=1 FL=1
MDQRLQGLSAWVNNTLSDLNLYRGPALTLETVSGDASFRRYFRCRFGGGQGTESRICVDAPPDKENNPVFIKVGRRFAAAGVPVPEVLATDLEQGFMLLSDLGDTLLKQVLNAHTAEHYLGEALQTLRNIMAADFEADPLPPYDSTLLQREMELFREWFCGRFLGLELSSEEHQLLSEVFQCLEQRALNQVQVPVHRDYHTRNLMVLNDGTLGVIDFQDAVLGPVTYDLLSLLRDETFPAWDADQVKRWVLGFAEELRAGDLINIDDQQFWLDFNAIGAQRHLKVAGIFARLCYRDNKSGYLEHTPQSLHYILMEIRDLKGGGPVCLEHFERWLGERIVPALCAKFPAAQRILPVAAVEPQQ